MDKVIRIDEYRRLHSRRAEAGREVWSCGVCGASAWTVSTAGQLRCSHCDTEAANLQLANGAAERERKPATDRPPVLPWNPLEASAQWWWTWAPQS